MLTPKIKNRTLVERHVPLALNLLVHKLLYPEDPIKKGCTAPPYSTDWCFAGPIIEQEEISLSRDFFYNRIAWAAWTPAPVRDEAEFFGYGSTPLIAAMRCFVRSRE